MKTKEELTALKEETVNEKDRKLTDEELLRCSGGASVDGAAFDARPGRQLLIALDPGEKYDRDSSEPSFAVEMIQDYGILTEGSLTSY